MARPRVLYVCHNHPSVRPGGAEAYAYETYLAMRDSGEFEPILLAKGGRPLSATGRPHEGTLFGPADSDPSQYFFYTDGDAFDYLYGTSRDKEIYTKHFRNFLLAVRPDVVHFQHTLHLGYDLIREVRNTLPDAPIVYTLHEFAPICHRNGQLVRTVNDNELCTLETPRRCHECFPNIPAQTFFMRKRFIRSHLSLVDLFLAPSQYLRGRYIEWGIPPERIRYEEVGRRPVTPVAEVEPRRARNQLGFFGQLSEFKGVKVLLNAMRLLADGDLPPEGNGQAGGRVTNHRRTASPSNVHLWIHGTNLDWQPGQFQNEFKELLEVLAGSVTFVGRYDASQLPRLMANIDWVVVPSIWWENCPLVVQEAFLYGRPVICSDVGGMAEKVSDGVNGLHFRVGDPHDLARTIRRAVASTELWTSLRKGIPPVYPMESHVTVLGQIYRELMAQGAVRQ